MNTLFKSSVIAAGLALFSMFFGAGNLVFPLTLGQMAGDQNLYTTIGMLITAVLVPILGVCAMLLYESNYRAFFYRLGIMTGTLFILLSMIIIGPLVAIPRTITLTYSIFTYSIADTPLWLFSIVACGILFLFTVNVSRIIDILGYILTPLLLLTLAILIITGLYDPPAAHHSNMGAVRMVYQGMVEGYNTLDLLASLFFSTLVFTAIKNSTTTTHVQNHKYFLVATFKAALIGGSLLALIYITISYVAALYALHPNIINAHPDQLIAALSFLLLGPYGGITAVLLTALACLTTAISLTVIFAKFCSDYVFRNRIGYIPSLILTIALTYIISLMGFSGIVKTFFPIIVLIYPVFIVLCLCNILHKLYGFNMVKIPAFLTLLASFYISYHTIL